MDRTEYSVSEAVQLTGVPSHVLRYWEEELQIEIRRTSQGHRVYSERDVEIFRRVKDLKEKGIQLKAIRVLLDGLSEETFVSGERDSLAGKIREIERRTEPNHTFPPGPGDTHSSCQTVPGAAACPPVSGSDSASPASGPGAAACPPPTSDTDPASPASDTTSPSYRDDSDPIEQYEIIVDEKKENLRQFEAILKRLIQEVVEEQNEKLEHAITGIIREEIEDLYLQYFGEGIREAASTSEKETILGRIRKLLRLSHPGRK